MASGGYGNKHIMDARVLESLFSGCMTLRRKRPGPTGDMVATGMKLSTVSSIKDM